MASVSSVPTVDDDNSTPQRGLARKITCPVTTIGEQWNWRIEDEEGFRIEPVPVHITGEPATSTYPFLSLRESHFPHHERGTSVGLTSRTVGLKLQQQKEV